MTSRLTRIDLAQLSERLGQTDLQLQLGQPLNSPTHGRVVDAVGTLIRAVGVNARVGELCRLSDLTSDYSVQAEVVGFTQGQVWLSPMGGIEGMSAATLVEPLGRTHSVAVGDFLLGRLVDGMGQRFLDEGASMPASGPSLPVWNEAPSPLQRPSIHQPMSLGVRAIDGLLTVGQGQRVGIFAPAGCGKSTLLSMFCRNAEADVIVVALVGERGREVGDFVIDALAGDARARSVVVVATSDRPAGERLKAAFVATTYAEHFRQRGKRVLLLVDSVTRLARAAREIGLAAGEPPTRRGFPPSVFALLPRLFERTGLTQQGSITAFYTVLEESDEGSDPVGEEVHSLLDGAFSLSRKLAQKGHFPAIDVLGSVSRLMPSLVDQDHSQLAQRARQLMSKYKEIELLLRIGEYQQGADAEADAALACRDALDAFLRQPARQVEGMESTLSALGSILQ